MHLVEVGDQKILLDCGVFRSRREEHRPPRDHFPFDPGDLDAVVLSHAHLDHCGNLPHLVRQGFDGPIYCTAATRDLLGVLLEDNVRFQETDAFVHSVLGGQLGGREALTSARPAVHSTLDQCVPLAYGQMVTASPDIEVRLSDAGHILGSAMVTLSVYDGDREQRLLFTGDLGRSGVPYLEPAAPAPDADVIVCESTYGGRRHDPLGRMAENLIAVVRTTQQRGGKILIPAFSLGRTQLVVHYLHKWIREGLLPRLPLFVDGSTAYELAEVHARHPDAFDPSEPVAPLGTGDGLVHFVRSREESEHLSTRREPCVIIAPSGMCDGGRILTHLKHNLDDPRCTVVLVSYQAANSLGRKLLEPRPSVCFHGRTWNLWADVVKVDGFSGHADHADLLAFLEPLAGGRRKVRLVHGEPEPAGLLARDLRQRGFADVAVPAIGDEVSLS